MNMGGVAPAALNGANEAAVELFLNGKIEFYRIPEINQAALESAPRVDNPSIENIIQADAWAREFVREQIR